MLGGGADSAEGGDGGDTIHGLDGDHWLDGGAGRDRLIGNEDAELFLFCGVPESISEADIIIDFTPGLDRIGIRGAVFDESLEPDALDTSRFESNTTGQATTPGLGTFVFETDTGRLWWDADGHGGEARGLVAILRGGVILGAGDIVVV